MMTVPTKSIMPSGIGTQRGIMSSTYEMPQLSSRGEEEPLDSQTHEHYYQLDT
jgi:hypothetical protein